MTSRDFVYWLQGFFEVSETNTLTERQVALIQAHLDMVLKYEKEPKFVFVSWFKGYFFERTITPREVNIIRTELNSVFEHVIDPTFGDKKMQDDLNTIHNRNSRRSPGEVIVKC
jgi:hypothetical protein